MEFREKHALGVPARLAVSDDQYTTMRSAEAALLCLGGGLVAHGHRAAHADGAHRGVDRQLWIQIGFLFVTGTQTCFLSRTFGPPFFSSKSVLPKDTTLQEDLILVPPFIALQIFALIFVMMVPTIALWLPEALTN
ncbi:hypothetical protein [Ostreiculturibacter nitratireducens]|uniref:hypothetical protein n=1 Tax=Ostreiculturibacter nitratireducens TaxID=3075226 RepID=UPI0031B59B6B